MKIAAIRSRSIFLRYHGSVFSTLRKCVTLAALGAGLLSAVPCPTDTVANYVLKFGFGKGVCTISAITPPPNSNPVELTISQFTFVDPIGLGLLPSAPQLLVTPVTDANGIGLQLTSASPIIRWEVFFQQRVDDVVEFVATATKTAIDWPGIDHLYIEMNDRVILPPAFLLVTEIYCPGGVSLPPDQTCPASNGQAWTTYIGPSTNGNGTTIRFFPPYFSAGLNGNCLLRDTTVTGFPAVCAYPSIAVNKAIDANAIQGGRGEITRVVNQFGRPVGTPP